MVVRRVRGLWLTALVVSVLLAGCGGKREVGPAEVEESVPTASSEASGGGVRAIPYNHTEVFVQQGNAFIGTRGYSRVCGALAEHGIAGYDAFTWTWDLPVTVVSEVRLSITGIKMTVGSGAFGQVEGFLISPEGEELGRASFSGIGGSNESLSLPGPLVEGDYQVHVRVCGPDTQYRVLAEARYDE